MSGQLRMGMTIAMLASLASVPGCGSPTRNLSGSGAEAGDTQGGGSGDIAAGGSRAGTAGRANAGRGGGNAVAGGAGDGGDSSQGGNPVGDAGAGGVDSGGANAGGGSLAGGAGAAGGSGCATACASYQFCASNKCLPTYDATRVLPAIDQTSGGGGVKSAVVLTDKAQGDLIIQLSGDLTLSDPGASHTTTITTDGQDYAFGYARYTADGNLAWFRSKGDIKSAGSESNIALVPPSDFALSYNQYDPSGGPVAGTYSFRAARINGNTGNTTWAAKFPSITGLSTGSVGYSYEMLPRANGDILAFIPLHSGETPGQNSSCTVTDNGTSGSWACSGTNYAYEGVPSVDGSTVWLWGAPGAPSGGATYKLNPFATDQTPFSSNPYQYGGEDAFIVGIRGASTTVGPWLSEGDYGPGYVLAALPDGNLAVAAGGTGYMTFNGGQALLSKSGNVLIKIDTKTGKIVWRTALGDSDFPAQLIAAPGGRIAALMNRQAGASVDLYDGTTGGLLSSLPLASQADVVVAGQTDLFVIGDYVSAYDFDPGTSVDKPTSSRGVFISRYSF